MRGDQLIIERHHTERAADIADHVLSEPREQFVVTVAGESGAGKSEVGSELARIFVERGCQARVIQQDDYFMFPPQTNHEMRRRNIEQVGPYEVKLDFLDSNLRSYKRGENPIYAPCIDYQRDTIEMSELDLSDVDVLVVEGTYTSLLRFSDVRVFIDRNFEQTAAHREARARDRNEEFMRDVLAREHSVISEHRNLADLVIDPSFKRLRARDGQSRASKDDNE